MGGGHDKRLQQVHHGRLREGTPRKRGVPSAVAAVQVAETVRDQHQENGPFFPGRLFPGRLQRGYPVELVEGQVLFLRPNRLELIEDALDVARASAGGTCDTSHREDDRDQDLPFHNTPPQRPPSAPDPTVAPDRPPHRSIPGYSAGVRASLRTRPPPAGIRPRRAKTVKGIPPGPRGRGLGQGVNPPAPVSAL